MFFGKKNQTPVPPVKEAAEPADDVKNEAEQGADDKLSPVNRTIIGKGITFEGDFESEDPIKLNGTIKGDIESSNSVHISRDGSYFGNASMRDLHVDGHVDGKIKCEDIATFTNTATMTGDLVTARLKTDEGSGFSGSLKLKLLKAKKAEPKDDFSLSREADAKLADSLAKEGDIPVSEADLFG